MLRIDLVGGGENFLNPEAISLINKCAKEIYKDVKIWICTNGTVFNEKILSKKKCFCRYQFGWK